MRTTVIVCRASSTWASQYWIAPVSASLRRHGASRSACRRVRCRWRGSPRAVPEVYGHRVVQQRRRRPT